MNILASRPASATGKSERFDLGKYKETVIGREVPPHMVPRVKAVWATKRHDEHGDYWALHSVPVEGGAA